MKIEDYDLPDPKEAAQRLIDFISWFGDGDIWNGPTGEPECFSADIEAVIRALQVESQAA